MTAITSFTGKYRFLSNFYPSPMAVNGLYYPTVEHAFQASKTLDEKWIERIQQASLPSDAKRLGRLAPLRPDWERIKLEVMEYLLQLKFRSPTLRDLLLQTGDAVLIEGNTWEDTYWGQVQTAAGFAGENHLGRLLMKLREEYKGAA